MSRMLDRSRTIRMRRGRALVVAAVLLAGAGPAPSALAGNAESAPEVGIVTVQPRPVTLTKELPGRVTRCASPKCVRASPASSSSAPSSRAAWSRRATYSNRIDPLPFEVELESAKAALARAEAACSRRRARRTGCAPCCPARPRRRPSTTSRSPPSGRRRPRSRPRRRRSSGRRSTSTTPPSAPDHRRIGRALVTEGALVGQTEATHLATSSSSTRSTRISPVGDRAQPAQARPRLRAPAPGSPDAARVRLLFDDGTPYPHTGRRLFSDVTSIRGREGDAAGRVPQPAGRPSTRHLRAGADRGGRQRPRRYAAPPSHPAQQCRRQRGLCDQRCGPGRPAAVRTGRTLGDQVVIEDGLQAGNRVVVEGFQKFVPGGPVTPVPWSGVLPPPAPRRTDPPATVLSPEDTLSCPPSSSRGRSSPGS